MRMWLSPTGVVGLFFAGTCVGMALGVDRPIEAIVPAGLGVMWLVFAAVDGILCSVSDATDHAIWQRRAWRFWYRRREPR